MREESFERLYGVEEKLIVSFKSPRSGHMLIIMMARRDCIIRKVKGRPSLLGSWRTEKIARF